VETSLFLYFAVWSARERLINSPIKCSTLNIEYSEEFPDDGQTYCLGLHQNVS